MKYRKVFVTAPWEIVLREDNFTQGIEGPHDVIIQNMYSHLSAGTEMACVSGIEDWFNIPDVPGYTAVGKVLKKGAEVKHVEAGDVVFTYGPHAGIFRIDVTDRWHGVCVKVPDGLDPAIAAFTHMGVIAMTALRKSDIELGDFVAVSGMGAIGNLAAQFAQFQGARVIGIDINQSRLDMAEKSGVGVTIHSAKEDIGEMLRLITGGEMISTWIDATGQSAVVNESMHHIASNGEMILLGSPRAAYETNLTPFLQKIHLLDGITVKGALEFLLPTHRNEFTKHSIEKNASLIMELMRQEVLQIAPIFSHRMDPADASTAYHGLKNDPDNYIGVVFDWT